MMEIKTKPENVWLKENKFSLSTFIILLAALFGLLYLGGECACF